ncbi:MAG: hypothetical protein N4A57_01510 [Anaeromicrobium sp.]|uniref:hypothetical protein n=1 Tax=Anaeromicrobium sp. TaxID=1929132 RepID=UPI0025F1E5FA|nr:hypothetical protein [Anaeromicrobium sp.]MCT4592943.1 hypothetical protein [Anaeromicrobium sp.]
MYKFYVAIIRERLDSRIKEKTPFTKRIVKKLSLIILTAELVKKFLKINLNIDGITDLLLEIESEKGKDIDIGKQAFEYFLEVFNQYNKNFYYGSDECVPSTLWGKIVSNKEDGTKTVYILTKVFNEIMERGGFESPQTVLNNWRDKSLLDCEPKRLSKKKTLISGQGQARVYCINFPKSLFPDDTARKRPKKIVKTKISKLFEDDSEEKIS